MALLPALLKMLDVVVARPLCAAAGGLLRPRATAPAGPPGRVLVIRPGGIGDAVLFVPLLQHLRRAWPAARIDVLAERRNGGVLAGTGLADEVLLYDVPRDLRRALRGGYDLVIDTEQYHAMSAVIAALTRAPRRVGFATNARGRLLTDPVPYDRETYEARLFLDLGRAATGIAPAWDPEVPFYPVPPAAAEEAARRLAPLAGRPLVGIHPGASIPERRWPEERYAELASRLAARGLGIVVLGGREDRAAARGIAAALGDRPHADLAGQTTLAVAAAAIARLDVLVCADTGLLHLAYAVGTSTVHLFGPGVLSKWGPPGRRFTTVAAHVPCSPCTIYGYTPPCCQGMACMLDIGTARVEAEVVARLARDEAAP